MSPEPGTVITIAVPALCLALLCFGALHDLIARTIPDVVPASLALLGLAAALHARTAVESLAGTALVFGGALLCWWRGWLGGGDAKLLGAVALLVPPARLGGVVTAIAAAGVVLALPYIACRGRIARPAPAPRSASLAARAWRAERFRLRRGGPLPYGIAIAVGAAFGLLGGPR